MSPKKPFPLLFSFALALGLPYAQASWTLASPDGAVQATVQLSDSGGKADYPAGVRLYYSVSLDNQVALPLSPLGITRADQDFTQGLVFDSASAPRAIDEAYTMVVGKRRQCRNHAQERTLSFHNAAGARLQLVLRAYAEGVAFRYVFPETNATPLTVTGEGTGFRLPAGSQGWMMAYDTVFTYRPAYEAEWNKVAAGTASPSPAGWALPMLFQTPAGHWIFLGETEVTENYCGSHLGKNAPSLVYRIAFPAANEMQTSVPANPSWTLPWAMPWRMVMVAKTPGPIVESTLPTDLASPSVVADPSWIKPGRASWSWWSNGNSPKTYSLLTPFVDLAQQMTWEYSLVDANWNTMTGGTWQGVVDYAKAKNVGILLWYNSSGPYNAITDAPRDRINIEATRKTEF
jgi:alpha-glucosidase